MEIAILAIIAQPVIFFVSYALISWSIYLGQEIKYAVKKIVRYAKTLQYKFWR